MGGSVVKTLFGAILFVGFLGLVLIEIVASGGTKVMTTPPTPTTILKGNFKSLDVIPRDSPVVVPHLDPHYMSKRRVPNGPDPIHNRRAGKSKQPPGRS